MAIKLTMSGRERCDCTAPYRVDLDHTYTMVEFIEEILNQRYREWGYFGVFHKGANFGWPKCEYCDGRLIGFLPDDILKKRITKVEADGGWSRMDYLFWLEEDEHGNQT